MPRKGDKLSDEQKALRSVQMRERWKSEAFRAKVSAHRVSRPMSQEARDKMSADRTGKPLSAEHKEAMRISSLRMWQDEEYRARHKAAMARPEVRAKKYAGEFSANVSAGRKRYWATVDPEERRRQIQNRTRVGSEAARIALKGRVFSEETKQRMSAAQSRRFAIPEERHRIGKLAQQARVRSQGLTDIERIVEAVLQALGVAYIAQHPIGSYTADFYIDELRLVIECDGTYWHSGTVREERDARRDAWLQSQGYRVVRLAEPDIKRNAGDAIARALAS